MFLASSSRLGPVPAAHLCILCVKSLSFYLAIGDRVSAIRIFLPSIFLPGVPPRSSHFVSYPHDFGLNDFASPSASLRAPLRPLRLSLSSFCLPIFLPYFPVPNFSV